MQLVLHLGIQRNRMFRFLMKASHDPPLSSSTDLLSTKFQYTIYAPEVFFIFDLSFKILLQPSAWFTRWLRPIKQDARVLTTVGMCWRGCRARNRTPLFFKERKPLPSLLVLCIIWMDRQRVGVVPARVNLVSEFQILFLQVTFVKGPSYHYNDLKIVAKLEI